MSIERLAVMFGGCGSYQAGARSTVGDAINRVEVAGMMAGLSAEERDYVYAFFGDDASRIRFSAFLLDKAMQLASDDGWRDGCDQVIAGMVRLVVVELFDGKCRSCHGTGYRGVRLCASCAGVGNARLSGRAVAEQIGIDQSRYVRLWRYRYDRIYVMAQDVECRAVSSVNRAFRRDAVLLD